jgi:curved DNA-binding protein CbpA
MDYYVLLGVPRTADADTIRSAFRALVRRYHPDAGEGSSTQKFRQIVEAYETLADPIRRRQYDRSLDPPRVVRRPDRFYSTRPEPLIPEAHVIIGRTPAETFQPIDAFNAIDPFDEFDAIVRALEEVVRRRL